MMLLNSASFCGDVVGVRNGEMGDHDGDGSFFDEVDGGVDMMQLGVEL